MVLNLVSKEKQKSKFVNTEQNGLVKKFKEFPSNKEKEFLSYFNTTDKNVKEKEIKYIEFVGKKVLEDQEVLKIVSDKTTELENNITIKRKMDLSRFNIELDTQKCCINNTYQGLIVPNFNNNLNDKFFKTRFYFDLFLHSMTKVLIRNRANKRLTMLQNMIRTNNIKTSTDFEEYCNKDWLQHSLKDGGGSGDGETSQNKIKIKFVGMRSISRSQVYLSNDYNLETLKQEIQHENNINLEELFEFSKLERNDAEVVSYKGKNFVNARIEI